MAKRLECPIDGCHRTFEAATEDEIMSEAAEHAESTHPDLELDEETVAGIRSGIQDV
ncbi:Uncharacterized protein HSRCO_1934 [Halanaeroarchaeum sp. HSR-CO]|uniref:DUF1059 domain-containing protein n=1 Tax=Halanaeroarchaeum sp. HSR-CO TaxID=2866382 RepID=UPI00217DD64E|nr:DUF1059 domain-containing protein [Halanaeroarchaeum sp. HSR-CO]UWG48212.1 Uncharacterized protein HSRCO_1934 [Halanaeroarchaeum sp. HSR-CO]